MQVAGTSHVDSASSMLLRCKFVDCSRRPTQFIGVYMETTVNWLGMCREHAAAVLTRPDLHTTMIGALGVEVQAK